MPGTLLRIASDLGESAVELPPLVDGKLLVEDRGEERVGETDPVAFPMNEPGADRLREVTDEFLRRARESGRGG
jgi:hypothetical protein